MIDPKYYASQWLEFMDELYFDILEEKYTNNKKFKNPLTENQKRKLTKQGVPDIFISDLNC